MFSLDKEMKRFSLTMTGRQRKGCRNIRAPSGCELPQHPAGKAARLGSSSRTAWEALPGTQTLSQGRAVTPAQPAPCSPGQSKGCSVLRE